MNLNIWIYFYIYDKNIGENKRYFQEISNKLKKNKNPSIIGISIDI